MNIELLIIKDVIKNIGDKKMVVRLSNPYKSINNYFSMKNNYDNLLNSFFNDSTRPYMSNDKILKFSIIDKKDSLLLIVEAPGLAKENIKLLLNDDIVTVTVERKPVTLDDNSRWIRSERVYGAFSRTFQLPVKINSENVEAEYKNGILKAVFKKAEIIQPKNIDIKIK
jgi:HSP20 family protein